VTISFFFAFRFIFANYCPNLKKPKVSCIRNIAFLLWLMDTTEMRKYNNLLPQPLPHGSVSISCQAASAALKPLCLNDPCVEARA
jgi:hypothetical protein